ncbi:MAG: PAS domain S-box protein [Euryarchaeota archaeon]|nr:PAS domain S-box protein [Euryarchaeota archaeon]
MTRKLKAHHKKIIKALYWYNRAGTQFTINQLYKDVRESGISISYGPVKKAIEKLEEEKVVMILPDKKFRGVFDLYEVTKAIENYDGSLGRAESSTKKDTKPKGEKPSSLSLQIPVMLESDDSEYIKEYLKDIFKDVDLEMLLLVKSGRKEKAALKKRFREDMRRAWNACKSSNISFFLADENGKVIDVYPSDLNYFAYMGKEIIGKNFFQEIFRDQNLKEKYTNQMRESNRPISWRIQNPFPLTTDYATVLILIYLIWDDNGDVDGYLGVVDDITNREREYQEFMKEYGMLEGKNLTDRQISEIIKRRLGR